MPTADQIERALQLIGKGEAQHAYFFDNLADPEWAEPLRSRGLFSSPPPPVPTDGGELHPRWVESQYLLRVAELAPDSVAQTAVGFGETRNMRVLEDMGRIAIALPPDKRFRVAKDLRDRVRHLEYLFFLLPRALAELICALAEDGEAGTAVGFAREVLAIRDSGEEVGTRRRVTARMRSWDHSEVVQTVLSKVASTAGLTAIELGCDLLEDAIGTSRDVLPPADHLEYWRPAIEDDEENRGEDLTQGLITALRDAALALIDRDPTEIGAVVGELRERGWHIFTRVALHALAERVDVDPSLAQAVAFDPQIREQTPLEHEHDRLMRALFPLLPSEGQEDYLAQVEAGPAFEPSDDPDLDRQRVEYWQLSRLAPVEEHLPREWRSRLNSLIETHGPPQVGPVRISGTWIGPTSPLSGVEIESMTADQVIDYIEHWSPSGAPMQPTAEGLARVLKKRVEKEPAEFAQLTGRIANLDPTYVRYVLHGLRQALRDGVSFDAALALALVEQTIEAPALDAPADERERRDFDPDWRWARSEAAAFLEAALDAQALQLSSGEEVWTALNTLSWDPEPDLEYERQFGGENMDPLTLSLNTVRGRAMHAVVAYAVWAKSADAEEGEVLCRLALDNLQNHLDPAREQSEAVRGVLGSNLRRIHWISSDWLRDAIPALFPVEPELQRLRTATWESFLAWGRPSLALYELLKAQYAEAVEGLTLRARGIRRDPAEAFAEQIAALVWWGALDAEDEFLQRVLAEADVGVARHVLEMLGRSLAEVNDEPLDPGVEERLVRLWTVLPSLIAQRPEDEQHEVLGAFGDWYGPGRLDDEWIDAELVRLAQNGTLARPDFLVFRRLISRAHDAPETALRFALAYVENPPETWSIDAHVEELKAIIEAGAEGTDGDRELASLLADRLVSRGYLQFRDHAGPP